MLDLKTCYIIKDPTNSYYGKPVRIAYITNDGQIAVIPLGGSALILLSESKLVALAEWNNPKFE